jgi:hypothetical protein
MTALDFYMALESLLSRGERSDEHYTWEFMRGKSPKDRSSLYAEINLLDDAKIAELVRQQLRECVDDYIDVLMKQEND